MGIGDVVLMGFLLQESDIRARDDVRLYNQLQEGVPDARLAARRAARSRIAGKGEPSVAHEERYTGSGIIVHFRSVLVWIFDEAVAARGAFAGTRPGRFAAEDDVERTVVVVGTGGYALEDVGDEAGCFPVVFEEVEEVCGGVDGFVHVALGKRLIE